MDDSKWGKNFSLTTAAEFLGAYPKVYAWGCNKVYGTVLLWYTGGVVLLVNQRELYRMGT
jgi:hypothetical protein